MTRNQLNNPSKSDELSIKLLISGINEWTDTTFNVNSIAYRAEGNANLVLSIIERRHILRLLKIVKGYNGTNDNELEKLQGSLKYAKSFMFLLPDEFKIIPQITEVIISDYDAFNRWLLPYRPEERTGKEVRCRYGLLYPDVACMPDRLLFNENNEQWNVNQDTFCIEIKPKQGWTLRKCDPCPFPGIDLQDIDKCRYCAMQYWKMKEGEIQKISQYCPVDLFSGYGNRMRRAIHGLIDNPQNNFRICKNGELIYDNKTEKSRINSIVTDVFKEDSSTNLDDFVNLIMLTLVKDFKEIEDAEKVGASVLETYNNENSCNEPSENTLPTNCILKNILDIQYLSKSYVWSTEDFKETHSNSPLQFVNNLFMKTVAEINNSRSIRENFLENLCKKECYVLGATALDCSVMLTFQCISDTDTNSLRDDVKMHIVTIGRKKFLVNASLVDVDPKTFDHFEKYIKQTNKSHKTYLDMLKN